jgi:hypothetical protein
VINGIASTEDGAPLATGGFRIFGSSIEQYELLPKFDSRGTT